MNVQVVHKYEIAPELWSETSLESAVVMPRGAKLLHVGEQNRRLMLWALVDRDAPASRRHVIVIPTGQVVELPKQAEHVGTVANFHGWLVFHVFDLGEEPAERS